MAVMDPVPVQCVASYAAFL